MTEINENPGGPYKVKIKDPFRFFVDLDTSEFTMYERGGFAD